MFRQRLQILKKHFYSFHISLKDGFNMADDCAYYFCSFHRYGNFKQETGNCGKSCFHSFHFRDDYDWLGLCKNNARFDKRFRHREFHKIIFRLDFLGFLKRPRRFRLHKQNGLEFRKQNRNQEK